MQFKINSPLRFSLGSLVILSSFVLLTVCESQASDRESALFSEHDMPGIYVMEARDTFLSLRLTIRPNHQSVMTQLNQINPDHPVVCPGFASFDSTQSHLLIQSQCPSGAVRHEIWLAKIKADDLDEGMPLPVRIRNEERDLTLSFDVKKLRSLQGR